MAPSNLSRGNRRHWERWTVWALLASEAVSALFAFRIRNFFSIFLSSPQQDKPLLNFVPQQRSEEERTSHYYSFRILQVADIHLGENAWTDWGPEQDRKTWIALDRIVKTEQPNLVVVSGDQLTANNVDNNATVYYDLLAKRLQSYGIPWAMIFGNHDDAPLEQVLPNGTIYRHQTAKTSREQLVAVDSSYPLSLTQAGPPELPGVTNYWLDIHFHDAVAARVLLLDSGGGMIPKRIDQTQIDWFWQNNNNLDVPVVTFQHIPSSINDFHFDRDSCKGMAEDGVAPLEDGGDAGIVGQLQAAGNAHILAVGHNHGNDYCCKHSDTLHLCFARHSGYGGYTGTKNRTDRGSRVYQLQLDADGHFVGWHSYVRMEAGDIIDEYDPKDL